MWSGGEQGVGRVLVVSTQKWARIVVTVCVVRYVQVGCGFGAKTEFYDLDVDWVQKT